MIVTQNRAESKTKAELEYECLFVIRDILLLSRDHISSLYRSSPSHIDKILQNVLTEIEEIII